MALKWALEVELAARGGMVCARGDREEMLLGVCLRPLGTMEREFHFLPFPLFPSPPLLSPPLISPPLLSFLPPLGVERRDFTLSYIPTFLFSIL